MPAPIAVKKNKEFDPDNFNIAHYLDEIENETRKFNIHEIK